MEFLSRINICDTSMTKKRVSKTMCLKPCFMTFICSHHTSMTFDFKSQLTPYHITGSFQFAFHFLAQILICISHLFSNYTILSKSQVAKNYNIKLGSNIHHTSRYI